MLLLVAVYLLLLTAAVSYLAYLIFQPLLIRRKIRRLCSRAKTLTPREFKKLKSTRGVKKYDFAGVYILYNEDKDMYYVGQGKRVLQRVGNHFAGRGNGDVYADYKYGDHFTIKMISLKNSEFRTLNELERNTIRAYHAFSRGYNKTRGNRG